MINLLPRELSLQALIVAALAFCLGVIAIIYRKVSRFRPSLPPGPPGNLLFGNSLPKALYVVLSGFLSSLPNFLLYSAYRHFEKWTQEYGPVFSIRQGFTRIIVIGRLQAAVEILEKEGAATVDRPRSIAAGETLSGGMRLVLTPAGERFKKMRRALHSHLQPKSVFQYAPVLMRSAKQLILDVIETPEKHQDHAKRYSASVVMALAYGRDTKSSDDPVVKVVIRCLTRLGNAVRPGFWKVDTYPFLKFIPGYLQELQEGHDEELMLFTSQLDHVRQKVERGDEVTQSFGKYVLERQKELDLSNNEAAYLAGSVFGAGSDTTASGISISVLAAACYPMEQQRLWEELESVVSRERAPTLMDQDKLPRTMAWVLEVLRWRPITAGGFPHKATRDILWNGYLIPAGATVIGNIWSIGRDPAYFPDPEKFNPRRWLKEDGQIRDDIKSYPFGFGRRVCPGQHIATASIFLNTALLFWSFRIKEDPASPLDEWAFTESANTHPLPFKVIFEPRTAPTLDALKEMLDDYGV